MMMYKLYYIRRKGDLPKNEPTDISPDEVVTETSIDFPLTCS
jgi:hypothetical protein